MLSREVRDELAAELAQAERSKVPIAPLTDAYTDIDVVDAYQIQLINIRQRVAEGRSDAVLGNPVTAVAWLVRKVEAFGVRLKAGDIVLPGSCTRAIDAPPGSHFVADFTGLGSVRLNFE